jgi:crotonobetainyl-CoA:carnitine CoA-transferase CaiB-like acyl-CoA transferase
MTIQDNTVTATNEPNSSQPATGRGPLSGVRVLDLTIAMAGPLCTQRLGEMGADITKIEAPGGGDFSRHAPMAGITKFGDATCYITLNQNKRSLVLDLKSDEGRAILYRLAEQADILVQNFRPSVAGRLGIDYATLRKINPRLVCGSISGYGDDGPMKDRPGQDLLLQSFTGLTMNGGSAGGLPHPSPLYMVDVTASHMVCEGVLAALLARGRTGCGQEVKVSMMGAIMEMQCQEITSYLESNAPPIRGSTPQVSVYQEPPYGVYQCAEGCLAIAQADLDDLAGALAMPELSQLKASRPAQADNAAVARWRDDIYRVLSNRLKNGTADQWDGILSAIGVWCVVVNDYDAFLKHPQARDQLVRLKHPVGGEYTAVAPAIRFSDNPEPQLTAAPLYGSHSEQILSDFGFSADEIASFSAGGVIYSNGCQE